MKRTTVVLSLLILSIGAGAQAPAFEVASIKPSESPILDFRVQPGGRLEVLGQTLLNIVTEAYDLKGYQISGGPPWIVTDRFDIVATSAGDPRREQVMAMLRALLADRFQLKTHTESKEGDVFALTAGKNGPKLKPPEGERSWIGLYRLTPPQLPGVKYALEGKRASMDLFAARLADQVRRPVLNHTGLEGEFNFRVEYSIDDNPETGPSIFSALQEQLGLKLEKIKGTIETLIIDHAAKPSPN